MSNAILEVGYKIDVARIAYTYEPQEALKCINIKLMDKNNTLFFFRMRDYGDIQDFKNGNILIKELVSIKRIRVNITSHNIPDDIEFAVDIKKGYQFVKFMNQNQRNYNNMIDNDYLAELRHSPIYHELSGYEKMMGQTGIKVNNNYNRINVIQDSYQPNVIESISKKQNKKILLLM